MYSPFSVKHITIIFRLVPFSISLVFTMLDHWEKAQFRAQWKDLPFYNHSRSRISVPQELSPGTVVANKWNSGDMQQKKKNPADGEGKEARRKVMETEVKKWKVLRWKSVFRFLPCRWDMRGSKTNILAVRWVSNKSCVLHLVFSFILIIVLWSQLLVQIGIFKLSWFGE